MSNGFGMLIYYMDFFPADLQFTNEVDVNCLIQGKFVSERDLKYSVKKDKRKLMQIIIHLQMKV